MNLLFFVLGVIIVLGIRVAAYQQPEKVHYHANFAVYVDGQQERFRAINYYEETVAASCSASDSKETENTPMSRTHMHGLVNNVVHVEDSRVTWGNFFTVLGWNIGRSYVATRDNLYQNSGSGKVTYLLNGKALGDVSNIIIGDQDKLLVSYGAPPPGAVSSEYAKIQNNALRADQSKDPASCGSHASSLTMRERLKHMF